MMAAQPVASPEGTATTYVSTHGPLIYAPRAARAQKVIFDTPDKQLIYAPDTPFRRFFDSRAQDFDSASREYAKTTILGDIVAMLRSREYTRDVVGAVIERYKDQAILSMSFAEQYKEAVQKFKTALLEGVDNDKSRSGLETAEKELGQLLSYHPDASAAAKAKIEILVAKTNKANFQTNLNAIEATIPLESSKPNETWRLTRANLLRDSIYLALLHQNYPEMEDEEIDHFIRGKLPDGVWLFAVGQGGGASKAMELELKERLKQRDFLPTIVERSIAKRADLFKKAGSPVDDLRDAQSTLKKFAENNLFSTTLSNAVRGDSVTLWRAFLIHANSHGTNNQGRAMLQPSDNRTRSMDASELRTFGNELRTELLKPDPASGQSRNLEKTKELLGQILSQPKFALSLCPEFSTSNTISALTVVWTNCLSPDLYLNVYTNLTNTWAGSDLAAKTNAHTNFVQAIVKQFEKFNSERANDDRVEMKGFTNFIISNIVSKVPVPSSTNAITAPALADILNHALPADQRDRIVPLNTDRARRRFIADFETVFSGWFDLLASDDPVVTAVLKSDRIRFASPDSRRQVANRVPSKVYATMEKGEGTNSVTMTAAFKAATDDPEIAYLFGAGLANPQVIKAFSQEFCSAFHDPKILEEAIKAEREADYEYWWFTFYPKAIPLGAKKLEGESIIEVNFPESVVPNVQFHRWLQDSALDGWSYRDEKEHPNAGYRKGSDREPQFSDIPGGLPTDLNLRNASALLRDTLTVLEASELKSRFTEVRPMMLHALDAFTAPRQTEDQRYWNGIRTLYDEVFPEDREWLRFMAGLIDNAAISDTNISKADIFSIKRPAIHDFKVDIGAIREQTNDVSRILRKLNFQIGAAGKGESTDLAKLVLARLAGEKRSSVAQAEFAREQFATELEQLRKDLGVHLESRWFESEFREQEVHWKKWLAGQIETQFVTAIKELYEKTPFTITALENVRMNLTTNWSAQVNSFRQGDGPSTLRSRAAVASKLQFALDDELNLAFEKAKSVLPPEPVEEKAEEDSEGSKYFSHVKEKVRAFALNFYLRGKPDTEVMNELRNDLKRLDFDPIHVLFSVLAVTETKARLPEKVNLFAWAGAQGVMMFASPDEFEKNSLLREHAVAYFNQASPLRGDEIERVVCNVVDCQHVGCIHPDALKALQAEADLYSLLLNAYFSKYPDVPSKKSIREAYFDDGNERLRSLVYNWLDYYGVLYHHPFSSSLVKKLGAASFLTRKSQELLFTVITNQGPSLRPAQWTGPEYRTNLSKAVNDVFTNEANFALVAELDEKLFDFFYQSLWEMATLIEQTERHVVPYSAIRKEDFRTFRSWARPAYQRGIQIVQMLPASRDDLVSMSINEGGVMAKFAAQGGASAAYDLNNLKMAQRYASSAGSSIEKLLESRRQAATNDITALTENLDEQSSGQRRQVFRDLSEIGKSLSSQGFSLGATGSGSAYARARAAMAYSRRREYLDAAITAAGRGDNFAKWVVRKSDLRSEKAKEFGKKLVAAAHNGFPNGDQPFHLLVKIPRNATKQDWNGRSYIHFNSTYVATKRVSAWRTAGFPGVLAKLPLLAVNPHWWSDVEEGLVGTQFPFMWDVRVKNDQMTLLREPNFLGGEIWLDDTDKIKYSEIQEMLTAEDTFIRLTREAQSGDLNRVMSEVEKESGEFGDEIRNNMKERMQKMDAAFSEAEQQPSLTNRIHKLEQDLLDLKSRLNPPPASSTTSTNSN